MALAVNQAFGITDANSDARTTGAVTTVAGSTLVVIGHYYSPSSSTPADGDVTDSKGNAYTLFPGSGNVPGVGFPGIAVYYNIGGTRGASHTITVDAPGTGGVTAVSVLEFTGNAVPNLLTVGIASDNTTPFSVTPGANISPPQLAIYGVTLDAGTLSTWTAPTGYTNIFNEPDGTTRLVVESAYKLLESGSAAVGATRGGTIVAAREVIVTFQEVVAPPVDYWAGHPDLGPGFGPNPFAVAEPPPTISVAGGIFADLGLVSETDSLFALARAKAKALGLPAETDAPLQLGRKKSWVLGLVSETDAALGFSRLKSRLLGLPLETDLPLSPSKLKQKAIGLVSETDSALHAAASHSRILGLVAETDAVFALAGKAKTKTLGLIAETDLPLALSRAKSKTLGLISETDLAPALVRGKSRVLGLVSETDLALALRHGITVTLGLVTESDAVMSLVRNKTKVLNLVTENDTVNGLVKGKSKILGLISENDLANSLLKSKRKAIGLVQETATALPMVRLHSKTLGLVVAVDTAFPFSKAKRKDLGLASETDLALHITRTGVAPTQITRIGPIIIGRF